MKQTLQLGLRQQLAMTPQLQQAIRLLQLSTMELQTEVQQALDSNYMLEVAEEGDEGEADKVNGAGDAGAAPEPEADVQPVDIPKELAVDSAWDDVYDPGPPLNHQPSNEGPGVDFDVQRRPPETLREHLLAQLDITPFSLTDRVIAEVLVDSIDEHGYLTMSLEEVVELVEPVVKPVLEPLAEVDVEEVEAVLHRIQHFEPVGVGARDVAECLALQLRQFPEGTPWLESARSLVRQHLGLLESRDYGRLQRNLGLDEDELKEVIGFIQTLNPKPGSLVDSAPAEYVIPDVYVRRGKEGWHVELNPDAMPRLRINSLYASFVRRGDDSADNESLRRHLNEARWFIKSLRSRSETLLKVATCIVERQQGFFEHGEEAMRPMVLHDVAESVGMHESTISRVTTQKFMHTPRGVFELKFFFSSQVSTRGGGGASSTAIKALIRKLIAEESPRKPLSDNKLAALLSEAGVNVARRTVAKYRESMAIASSSERRRLD